jgi:hypothetical protein
MKPRYRVERLDPKPLAFRVTIQRVEVNALHR